MSWIESYYDRGITRFREVESYRENGKPKRRIIRYLGKEIPKDIEGVAKGYEGVLLKVGKRVQVRSVPFGEENFHLQIGVINGIIKNNKGEYAKILFDNVVSRRRDWAIPCPWVGEILRENNVKRA